MSPTLTGRFFTSEPPGKPCTLLFTTGLSTPYYLTPVLNYTFMLIAQPLGAFEFVMHDLHTQTTKAF